jgi:hypothetical protein
LKLEAAPKSLDYNWIKKISRKSFDYCSLHGLVRPLSLSTRGFDQRQGSDISDQTSRIHEIIYKSEAQGSTKNAWEDWIKELKKKLIFIACKVWPGPCWQQKGETKVKAMT